MKIRINDNESYEIKVPEVMMHKELRGWIERLKSILRMVEADPIAFSENTKKEKRAYSLNHAFRDYMVQHPEIAKELSESPEPIKFILANNLGFLFKSQSSMYNAKQKVQAFIKRGAVKI